MAIIIDDKTWDSLPRREYIVPSDAVCILGLWRPAEEPMPNIHVTVGPLHPDDPVSKWIRSQIRH